jgi:hypothetical protein
MVKTRLKSNAEYVTPQRIGGRVTATKSVSIVRPVFRAFMALATRRTCRGSK